MYFGGHKVSNPPTASRQALLQLTVRAWLAPKRSDEVGPDFRFPDDAIDSYQNLPAYSPGDLKNMQSLILPRRSFLRPQATFVTRISVAEARYINFGFLTGFDSDTEIFFHFAESTLLLHTAKLMNDTFLAALPDLSMALLPFPRPKSSSWIAQFSRVLFGSQTPILWLDLFAAFTQEKPLCFRQMIISGTIIHLMLGTRDAEAFREQAFRELAIVNPHRRQPLHLGGKPRAPDLD